ncbi:hypothetical protein B0H10DRAFT_1953905 [Mycena sp. CBHHK59/15]|nr:hypothetical protein B0H10DRAFT_1953905 [Mycena sp. CBHHK59/15]
MPQWSELTKFSGAIDTTDIFRLAPNLVEARIFFVSVRAPSSPINHPCLRSLIIPDCDGNQRGDILPLFTFPNLQSLEMVGMGNTRNASLKSFLSRSPALVSLSLLEDGHGFWEGSSPPSPLSQPYDDQVFDDWMLSIPPTLKHLELGPLSARSQTFTLYLSTIPILDSLRHLQSRWSPRSLSSLKLILPDGIRLDHSLFHCLPFLEKCEVHARHVVGLSWNEKVYGAVIIKRCYKAFISRKPTACSQSLNSLGTQSCGIRKFTLRQRTTTYTPLLPPILGGMANIKHVSFLVAEQFDAEDRVVVRRPSDSSERPSNARCVWPPIAIRMFHLKDYRHPPAISARMVASSCASGESSERVEPKTAIQAGSNHRLPPASAKARDKQRIHATVTGARKFDSESPQRAKERAFVCEGCKERDKNLISCGPDR